MKYFLIRLLSITGLLKKINLTYTRKINGKHLRVPLIYGVGFDNVHLYELWMIALLEKILPLKKGVFVDNQLYRILKSKDAVCLQLIQEIEVHHRVEWSDYLFVPLNYARR